MDEEQFRALKAEFEALRKQWEATKNLEERLALSDRIMDVLEQTRALLDHCQNKLFSNRP